MVFFNVCFFFLVVRFSWLFVSQLVVLSWSRFIRYIESIFPLKFIIVYAPKHICCVDFLFLVFLTFVCLLLTLVHFLFLFMPLCCKTSENLKIIQSKFNYISCEFDCMYSDLQTSKMQFSHTFRLFRRFSTSFFLSLLLLLLLLFNSPLSCLHRLYCYVMVVICCIHPLLLCIHIYRYIEKVIFYFVNFRSFVLIWLHRTMLGLVRILSSRPNYSGQTNWLINTFKTKSHIGSVVVQPMHMHTVRWNLQLKTPYIAVHKFLGRRLLWKLFNTCVLPCLPFCCIFLFFLLFLCQNIT